MISNVEITRDHARDIECYTEERVRHVVAHVGRSGRLTAQMNRKFYLCMPFDFD